MRLQRLFPQTIFWRLTWLTALALGFSVAFAVTLYGYNRQQMIASQVTEQVGEVLADLEDRLDGLSPAEQAEWLALNRRPYAPHLLPLDSPQAPPAAAPRGRLASAIAVALAQRQIGRGDVRESRRPKRQLWVKVEMLGQPKWLVIPLGRFKSDSHWPLAASAAVFTLAALAVAALFAWRINRPLRELQAAAGQLGRGELPQALPEVGPSELKALSASFNRMLADLAANERERSVMLAGISHDVRTPLARLRLGVEMMHDESLRAGMIEDVGDIERILGQFIDFTRGAGSEELQACDPAELARSLVARYARSGCEVELDLADELPLAWLRPLALSRALGNLIDNARRYGAEPIRLEVQLEARQLCFVVIDHGPGIPAEQLDTVLQPFQRLDSARRADGGSGLGLAIVERVAQQHGGKLHLANRDAGGLRVTLSLPLRQGPAILL
ncbi:HAMP domain-containing protein [Chitinimonas arctica]|uniref:histidine kinase n=1 Tax=Chitinimonas arctica TaxID=2594795 RepID=A0A516SIG0_9NEIS|nr:ATP-binding protein [Chitinimonas arctica]QDQ27828.1 HAMP domain-containing protein [Chitinimonas arctica]